MKNPEIAFIMRSDEMIKDFNLERVTVKTSKGSVDRCFVGEVYGVPIAVIYGRFKDKKTTSDSIDYEQNIETVEKLGYYRIGQLLGCNRSYNRRKKRKR